MQALIDAGLYGEGLVKIDSVEMVSRYNECLTELGLTTTNLPSFSIDGLGWSPEISQEMGNAYYLSHGEANPLGIVLTPHQKDAAIYNPFHSYDWDLMQQWYRDHAPQISTLTQYEGICLDIDQEVDLYHRPVDLVLVGNVAVKSWTPSGLMEKVVKQKSAVRSFMNEADMAKLHEKAQEILASAEEIGDMRYKTVEIRNMQYSKTRNFFSRAFGGTFIVRSPTNGAKPLVLSKDRAQRAEGVTSVDDKRILGKLEEMGLIDYDPYWWKEGGRLYRLKTIRDSFLMDVLDEKWPNLNFVEQNDVEKKRILNDVKEHLPREYVQLARVIKSLEDGRKTGRIAKGIKPFFAHIPEGIDLATIEVVWYILALVCDGRNVVRLYRYDKNAFFDIYSKWNTPKKSWAIASIKYYNETH